MRINKSELVSIALSLGLLTLGGCLTSCSTIKEYTKDYVPKNEQERKAKEEMDAQWRNTYWNHRFDWVEQQRMYNMLEGIK